MKKEVIQIIPVCITAIGICGMHHRYWEEFVRADYRPWIKDKQQKRYSWERKYYRGWKMLSYPYVNFLHRWHRTDATK